MRLVTNEDGSRSVILERRNCYNCQGMREYMEWRACPNAGKAQNGKPCIYCGSKRKTEHKHIQVGLKPCGVCDENGTIPERLGDYAPVEWWMNELEFRVVASVSREANFNELNLGFGHIYTAVDYGRTRDWTDDLLIEKIRSERHSVQLRQLVANATAEESTDPIPLAPYIEIIRRADGYNVRAHR